MRCTANSNVFHSLLILVDVGITSSQPQEQLMYMPISNLTTGSELVHHANRIGINLRSAGLLRTPLPSARSRPQSTHVSTHERLKKDGLLPLSAWERHHSNIPITSNNGDDYDQNCSSRVSYIQYSSLIVHQPPLKYM